MTFPLRTIAPVDIRFKVSFCDVPAFNRVEPVSISGPVSNRMPWSAISRRGVFLLFEIPQVHDPF